MMRDAYESIKVSGLSGRYLPPEQLQKILHPFANAGQLEVLGKSERGLPVLKLEIGQGPLRILIWSQMHGNETTTTRALLDLLHALSKGQHDDLISRFRFCIIPMLNPDGALDYTRENANKKDLNRDAGALSQVESRLLDSCYKQYSPDFCFNLHDQRSIYSVGGLPVPATLSFLAPASDVERSVSTTRLTAMKLIAAIAQDLKADLPGGIGRYDDTFNPNCVGDRFQKKGSPTLLFEAGHYPGDYEREETRYYVFRALLSALRNIETEGYKDFTQQEYLAIPPNTKDFVDIRIIHPEALHTRYNGKSELHVQYREELRDGRVHFIPDWPEDELSSARYGHRTLDASLSEDRAEIQKDQQLSQFLI